MKTIMIALVMLLVALGARADETNTFTVNVTVVTVSVAEWRAMADALPPTYTNAMVLVTNRPGRVITNYRPVAVNETAKAKIRRHTALITSQYLNDMLTRVRMKAITNKPATAE